MKKDALQGGVSELREIRKQVEELNTLKQRKQELAAKEKDAQVGVTKKEKAIADEIKKTIKQRREDLEGTFDGQLKDVGEQLKKVETDKEKKKKKAMLKRIDSETSEFRSENEELRMAGKSVFKQEDIPFIYNNRLFFALYFPRRIGDIGIIILTLAVAFFLIPFGIYTFLFEGVGNLYLGISYIITILVFGALYLFIGKTKYKHQEALNRVLEMRKRIQESKKQQKRIKRQIEKDRDESRYDLGEFDQEIAEYKKAIASIMNKKKAALLEFDGVTAEELKRQITEANEEQLRGLKEEYRKVHHEGKSNLETLNSLSTKLSTEYESVLGKDAMTTESLDAMAKAIQDGKASTIGEAKDFIAGDQ